ncbi:MAG TPA: sulfatase-like hydrolase/transferase [Tepidisphaeraceae bacterium]|nr:sulfatase-like hydrolase/transferase [Tepidisphaeraceae bacterium]
MTRSLLVAVVAALTAGLSAFAADNAPPARPGPRNVVLILADDLGYGDLSCYGLQRYRTPNLDRLAADGARLTHAYVPVPYCAPTRAALLTGRYPSRCGMTRNPFPATDAQVKNADDVGLPADELTLADLFRKAGHRTACFGKWHLGHREPFRPLRRGFDEFYGLLYSNDMHPVELFDGDARAEYPVVQATLTRRLTDRAVDFLGRHRDKPFFLYLPYVAPHKPLAASDAFAGKTGAGLYADTVVELDAGVGRVLDRLKELGLDDRTLVLFASDNGPWYGGSTAGLRGMKSEYWEGGVRVPMIARLPGVIPAGRVVAEPAAIMDLFVTALAHAGAAPPADGRAIDGRDLLPVLTRPADATPAGAAGPAPLHDAIFATRGNEVVSVRAGRWRLYVRAPGPAKPKAWRADEPWTDPRGPDGERILAPKEQQGHPSQYPGERAGPAAAAGLLFDIVADPAEQRDVAGGHPEVVARLTELGKRFEAEARRKR